MSVVQAAVWRAARATRSEVAHIPDGSALGVKRSSERAGRRKDFGASYLYAWEVLPIESHLTPHVLSSVPRRPASLLLEAEQPALVSHVAVVVLLFVPLAPRVLGGATGGTWPRVA